MDFLKVYVDDKIIEEMKYKNNESILYDFVCNKDHVVLVIDYLSSIGISVIDELLVGKIDLFFQDLEEIQEHLNRYEIPVIVKMINEDISNFDLV